MNQQLDMQRLIMQVLTNKIGVAAISAEKSLDNLVKIWVSIALIGQWFFAAYIISVYALPAILGNPELTFQVSPTQGLKSENGFDTFMLFSHVLPAALLALSGLFQLFPIIRRKYPKFHRYNGRLFLSLGLAGALTGLYLSWGAGFRLSNIGAIGVTLNGILIPIAIFFAWKTAIKKDFVAHQRFAIHSFLLINGVWSFRLYLMAWYIINQGSFGNTRTIDGPADIALSIACYLLPMAIAEFIFWAKRKSSQKIKWAAVGLTFVGMAITLIGVGAASMMMWTPRISQILASIW